MATPITTMDWLNAKRDLSDALSTVIAGSPRFISLFPTLTAGKAIKHEWLQDQIKGRSVTVESVSGLVATVAAGDAGKLSVGTQLSYHDGITVYEVEKIEGTAVTLKVLEAFGASEELKAGVLQINSTPQKEASTEGEGAFHQSVTDYNIMQIFRKDIVLSGSALAIDVYGNENTMPTQVANALDGLMRDMNRAAIRGVRREAAVDTRRSAGGLYAFGMGGLEVDAGGAALDSFVVNDAAQLIGDEGGTATDIICGRAMARVLANEYKDKLQILREDTVRGAYVATVVDEINGSGIRIFADPDIPVNDVWVVDRAGFGIAPLAGRETFTKDTTPPTLDGTQISVFSESTFVFKNPKQRLCRIKNLKTAANALTELRA